MNFKNKTMKELRTYLKEDQDRMQWEFDLWRVLRDFATTKEGKNYDKRFIDAYKKVIYEKYGEDNIRWIYFDDIAHMRSIKIKFNEPVKSYYRTEFSYLVAYTNSDGKEVNLTNLDEQNQCWELDKSRCLDLSQLLQDSDGLKELLRKTNKANKAIKELAECLEEISDYPKYDSWKYDFKRDFIDQRSIEEIYMERK